VWLSGMKEGASQRLGGSVYWPAVVLQVNKVTGVYEDVEADVILKL